VQAHEKNVKCDGRDKESIGVDQPVQMAVVADVPGRARFDREAVQEAIAGVLDSDREGRLQVVWCGDGDVGEQG
jgi:hypothetical protein